jgi:hypothetical protein
MGHNEAVYQRADYQQHLLAGLKWAMGDIDLKPQPHHLPESNP